MVVSMTGFGRAKKSVGDFEVSVEIKSVNNRFFEYSSRIPRSYQFLDEGLKSLIKDRVSRGKVDVSVNISSKSENSVCFSVNEDYLSNLLAAYSSAAKKFKIKNDIKLSDLTDNPEIFSVTKADIDEKEAENALLFTAKEALDGFISMRAVEGEKLKTDINSRADTILECVSFIESRSPQSAAAYTERLKQKISELAGDTSFDEGRLLTEVAIFADKIAVDEETVRLKSHISQLKSLLETGGPIGRKLDFIVQEMNREANTIGSKAQDIEITRTVLDIKAEIEKIREQIQNIE